MAASIPRPATSPTVRCGRRRDDARCRTSRRRPACSGRLHDSARPRPPRRRPGRRSGSRLCWSRTAASCSSSCRRTRPSACSAWSAYARRSDSSSSPSAWGRPNATAADPRGARRGTGAGRRTAIRSERGAAQAHLHLGAPLDRDRGVRVGGPPRDRRGRVLAEIAERRSRPRRTTTDNGSSGSAPEPHERHALRMLEVSASTSASEPPPRRPRRSATA